MRLVNLLPSTATRIFMFGLPRSCGLRKYRSRELHVDHAPRVETRALALALQPAGVANHTGRLARQTRHAVVVAAMQMAVQPHVSARDQIVVVVAERRG